MYLNLIDAPTLFAAVDEALANADDILQPWRSHLRTPLCRDLLGSSPPSVARRRKSDPEWAQRAFDRKERLYRLDNRIDDAIREIPDIVTNLAKAAVVGSQPEHPMRMDARRFFRSLRHWKPEVARGKFRLRSQLHWLVVEFLDRTDSAWCRTHRHVRIGSPCVNRAGALTGTRCTTIEEIVSLGREARNCLSDSPRTCLRFLQGKEDIWSLRSGNELVAILRIRLEPEAVVTELLGPENEIGVAGHGYDLAQWLMSAGIKVGLDCSIRLVDIMPRAMWDCETVSEILMLRSRGGR